MKCKIKFFNERNPHRPLPPGEAGHSGGTAGDKSEEGGDDVKSSWPLRPGPHTCYEAATRSESQKAGLSTDCSLQLDCMKMESLVIAHQHGAVNMFPGLVHTARHTIRVGGTRSRQPDRKGGGSEGTSGEGGEVVTR